MKNLTPILVTLGLLALLLCPTPGLAEGQSQKPVDSTRSFEALSCYIEGMMHFCRQEPEEGQKAMQKALGYDPNYVPALFAVLEFTGPTPEAALQAGERLLALFPFTDENWNHIDRIYQEMMMSLDQEGQRDKWIALLRRPLESSLSEKHKRWFRGALVTALLREKQTHKAFQILEEQVASCQQGSAGGLVAAFGEAHTLTSLGAYDAARAIITQQLVGKPLASEELRREARGYVVNHIVQAAERAGRTAGIQEWLNQILTKVPPTSDVAHYCQAMLAEVLGKEGNWKEAAQAYEKAGDSAYDAGVFGAAPALLIKAADIYKERLGDTERAAKIYTRVLTDQYLLAPNITLDLERTDRRAREALREMGKSVPPQYPGLREKSVWPNEPFKFLHIAFLDAGYSLVLSRDPAVLLENLCSSEVAQAGVGHGRVPWGDLRELADYVFRGGGLLLMGVWPGSDSVALAREFGFDARLCPGVEGQPLKAVRQDRVAKAAEELKCTPWAALVCLPSAVALEVGGVPVLGVAEYGLGRVVVSSIGYGSFGIEPSIGLTADEEAQIAQLYLALSEWVRGGGEGKPGLKALFRRAHDAIARRDYREATRVLEAVCSEHPGSPWEEQARYLMADILRDKLEDFKAAQEEYETVFRKSPSGNLALAALMGRAACLGLRGVSWEKVREQYRQVAGMAPETEIGAAARVHEAALTLLHEGPKQALEVFRKAVDESREGLARTHALCGLAYCAEKTGAWAEAKGAYEGIIKAYKYDRVPLDGYGNLWKEALLEGTSYIITQATRQAPRSTPPLDAWAKKRLEMMEQARRTDTG